MQISDGDIHLKRTELLKYAIIFRIHEKIFSKQRLNAY